MTQNYIGMTVPDCTLLASDGQSVTLSDLRGNKILFYFFTSPGGGN